MKSFIRKSFSVIFILCFMLIGLSIFGVTKVKAASDSITIDLSKDNTTTASPTEMTWVNYYYTIAVAKGSAGTATNNYYPGTEGQSYTSTRFYKNSILTITPASGYSISSIVFSATTDGYASAFQSSSWTNATAAVDGTTVTVTPTDGTTAFSATIGGACGFTQIVVNFEEGASLLISSIAVKTAPSRLGYKAGETFDATGLEMTLTFSDASTVDYPYDGNEQKFTFNPEKDLLESNDTITITIGNKSTTQAIDVSNVAWVNYKFSGLTHQASLRIDYTYNKYFEKVTTDLADFSGTYLIVYEDGNVAFDGSLETLDDYGNKVGVSISAGIIEYSDTLFASSFIINKIENTSNYTIQSSSGYYIGKTTNDNGMNVNNSTQYSNSISIDEGNAIIASTEGPTLKYNSASNQLRFRYYKTGQKDIQLYKLITEVDSINSTNIRFKVSPSTELSETIDATGTSITYGYLYAKSEKTIGEMTYGAFEVSAKVCTNFNADGSYSLVLTNIPSSAWDTKITVRAFVCIDGNYYYSDIRVLSVQDACALYIANTPYSEAVEKALVALNYIKDYIG